MKIPIIESLQISFYDHYCNLNLTAGFGYRGIFFVPIALDGKSVTLSTISPNYRLDFIRRTFGASTKF